MTYAEQCVAALRAAVDQCIRPGERVGLFLSGGLDSAIIQAIGRFEYLYCCTWEEVDNLTAARLASCNITVTPVTFTYQQMLEALPDVAELTKGQGTWSQVCQYFMAKQAALDGCDAVLTGECADELFGGYSRYKILYWLDRMWQDPKLEAYHGIIEQVVGEHHQMLGRMLNRCGSVAVIDDAFRGNDYDLVSAAAGIDCSQALPRLLANETAIIEAFDIAARYPFGADVVREFAATLQPEQLVTERETKTCLRNAARLLGVHHIITEETTKRGLYIPQSWRPDGEALWSRRWFEALMEEAYAQA